MTDVFGVTLPTVGGSRDTWATSLNNILIAADADNTTNETNISTLQTTQGLKLISTSTASASSAITFTGLSSTYFKYIIEFSGVYFSTTSQALRIRTSTDNGSSYDSGASDYDYIVEYLSNASGSSGTTNASWDQNNSTIITVGNPAGGVTATHTTSGQIVLSGHAATTSYTNIEGYSTTVTDSGALQKDRFSGVRKATANVDAIQIYPASGNITAGTFKLYGVLA